MGDVDCMCDIDENKKKISAFLATMVDAGTRREKNAPSKKTTDEIVDQIITRRVEGKEKNCQTQSQQLAHTLLACQDHMAQ